MAMAMDGLICDRDVLFHGYDGWMFPHGAALQLRMYAVSFLENTGYPTVGCDAATSTCSVRQKVSPQQI